MLVVPFVQNMLEFPFLSVFLDGGDSERAVYFSRLLSAEEIGQCLTGKPVSITANAYTHNRMMRKCLYWGFV